MIKFHPPEKCPFCGAGVTGGGDHQVYFECGAHVWIEQYSSFDPTYWHIKGHVGDCHENNNSGE